MEIYKKFILVLFIVSAIKAEGQNLRGLVREESSYKSISDATITAGSFKIYKAVTDSTGKFLLALEPGLYNVMVFHPDFKTEIRTNILVSTKQHAENFYLKNFVDSLDEIIVKPEEETHEITETKLHQYAASFYDPARLINTNAAAINTNDQANHFSIRGASPNFIQWKIEDIEVVNPNHLENAGTLNDRPATNGGGVSMISAQLLDRSPFFLPVYKPMHGNALSGMFNIQFRNGNEEKSEHIAQASFLGLDFSTEGPIKKNRSSYLVNGRYSTIGLLSEMGVDFGGEQTNYKDISACLNFNTKTGTLKFFSITGGSSNLFRGEADTVIATSEKDMMNISYRSFTSINGLSYVASLGKSMFIKAAGAYSIKQTDYSREPIILPDILENNREKYETGKSSGLIYLGKSFNRLNVTAGSYINYFTGYFAFRRDSMNISKNRFQSFAQPFLSAEYKIRKITFNGGIHSVYEINNNLFIPLPNAKLQFALNEKHALHLGYSKQAQLQNLLFYSSEDLSKLKPAEMNYYSAAYKFSGTIFKASVEGYHQIFSRLPANDSRGFNAINYFNEQINYPLSSTGTATISGIDLTVQINYNHYYLITSASFLRSAYPGKNELSVNRFDPGQNYFVTSGKEWRLKNQNKFFNLDLRGNYRKGFRQTNPLSSDFSPLNYNYSLPDYFRIDLRISYRKSRTKSTTILALDIQNVSGKRNVGFYYYDRLKEKVETVYQLGLIPVLSYKLFF